MTNSPPPAASGDSTSHLRAALASVAIAATLGFNFVYTPIVFDNLHPLSPPHTRVLFGIQSLFRSISDLSSQMPNCNVRVTRNHLPQGYFL
jgi:hypothetical protein